MPLGLTSVITLLVTVLSMLALTFLVQKTKLGKAMRAVSEDMDAARLMGINVNSTISFTFAVGSALAGIGSVLYCCSYPQATPTMGSMLGLKASLQPFWAASAPFPVHDRRHRHRPVRVLCFRHRPFRMEGCRHVCDPDHRAAGQAHRLPWPQGSGKGVRRA